MRIRRSKKCKKFLGSFFCHTIWESNEDFFSSAPLLTKPPIRNMCEVSQQKMRFFSLHDMRFPTFCMKFSNFPKFSKFSKNVKFGFLLSRRVQRYPLSGVLWGKMLTHLWSAHSCTVHPHQFGGPTAPC